MSFILLVLELNSTFVNTFYSTSYVQPTDFGRIVCIRVQVKSGKCNENKIRVLATKKLGKFSKEHSWIKTNASLHFFSHRMHAHHSIKTSTWDIVSFLTLLAALSEISTESKTESYTIFYHLIKNFDLRLCFISNTSGCTYWIFDRI